MLNDVEEKIKKIKTGLNGDWEYEYIATSDYSFSENERIRGGIINITVRRDWSAITIDIEAKQLWAKKEENKKVFNLEKKIIWESYGNLTIHDGKPDFTYFLDDSKEKSCTIVRDMVIVDKVDEFFLEDGTFDYYRKGEEKVTGVARFRKMKDNFDFIWKPKAVKYKPKEVKTRKLENEDNLKFSPQRERLKE